MMRIAIAAAALAALAGSANAADALRGGIPASGNSIYSTQPMITGDLSFSIGAFNEGGGTGTSIGLFSGAARANAPIQGSMNVEVQTSGNAFFDSGASEQWTDAYAHVWERQPSSAWGLFGGTEFLGEMINSVGAEGKAYLGNATFGGAVARIWGNAGDAWVVNGSADAFIDANHRVGLTAQVINASGTNLWSVKADAEARFAGVPWSLFGNATALNEFGTTVWQGMVGMSWFLDAPGSTLQSHQRDVPWNYNVFFGVP